MSPPMIWAIRHGEKPANAEDPHKDPDAAGPGLEVDGKVSPNSLTIRGWQRAGALAGSLLCGRLTADDGVDVIVPSYGHSEHHRPYETVNSLAVRLGNEPQPLCDAADVNTLHEYVVAADRTLLICWEHDALAKLADLLCPPSEHPWPEGRFDVIWQFTPDGQGGFTWQQHDQDLLPDDAA
jgi:broad specificity phosphatase PhoE